MFFKRSQGEQPPSYLAARDGIRIPVPTHADLSHVYDLLRESRAAETGAASKGNATHIAVFDLATVLELIDELERLRETLATVKAITDGTPECDKYDDKSPVTCGWKFDLQRIKEVVK